MHSMGSIINNVIILGLFIYLALVANGIVKLNKSKQERFNKMMEQYGKGFKMLVYAGIIMFIILIFK